MSRRLRWYVAQYSLLIPLLFAMAVNLWAHNWTVCAVIFWLCAIWTLNVERMRYVYRQGFWNGRLAVYFERASYTPDTLPEPWDEEPELFR